MRVILIYGLLNITYTSYTKAESIEIYSFQKWVELSEAQAEPEPLTMNYNLLLINPNIKSQVLACFSITIFPLKSLLELCSYLLRA